MKRYDCLVPGCNWHTEAESTAEIVRRASDHLRDVHEETEIRPALVERIKQRIVEPAPAP